MNGLTKRADRGGRAPEPGDALSGPGGHVCGLGHKSSGSAGPEMPASRAPDFICMGNWIFQTGKEERAATGRPSAPCSGPVFLGGGHQRTDRRSCLCLAQSGLSSRSVSCPGQTQAWRRQCASRDTQRPQLHSGGNLSFPIWNQVEPRKDQIPSLSAERRPPTLKPREVPDPRLLTLQAWMSDLST